MREIKTSICKLSKGEIHDVLDIIAQEARTARHICRKCGRAAHHKRLLCKPIAIGDLLPEAPAE